jgi:hypothetical protein
MPSGYKKEERGIAMSEGLCSKKDVERGHLQTALRAGNLVDSLPVDMDRYCFNSGLRDFLATEAAALAGSK